MESVTIAYISILHLTIRQLNKICVYIHFLVQNQNTFQQGNMVSLTSTENCKSLLVLTTDLNSTCMVGQNVMNSTKMEREKGSNGLSQNASVPWSCIFVQFLAALQQIKENVACLIFQLQFDYLCQQTPDFEIQQHLQETSISKQTIQTCVDLYEKGIIHNFLFKLVVYRKGYKD